MPHVAACSMGKKSHHLPAARRDVVQLTLTYGHTHTHIPRRAGREGGGRVVLVVLLVAGLTNGS